VPVRKRADGPIIVWDSPGTNVSHHTMMRHGHVVRSIAFWYRTAGGEARNTLADAPMGTRDGASFTQSGEDSSSLAVMTWGLSCG
jgi:hypothetical protein